MHNEILSIGPFTIYGYGLMIAIGLLAAYFTAEHRAKKYSYNVDRVYYVFVFGVLFGLLGAKLMYFITVLPSIIKDPTLLYKNFFDGFVVYGGIILGILAGVTYLKIKKEPVLEYLDLCIPSIPIGQAFGRIGCFLAGCCYGKETDSWFSITFHTSDYAPNNVSLFPSQLVSSAFDFLLFFLLCALLKKNKKPGLICVIYLLFYSTGRFIIEFFRGDLERGQVGILSTSQFISVIIFAVALILLLRLTVFVSGKSKA